MEGVFLSVEIKHRLNTIKKLKLVNNHQKHIKLVISHQLRKSYHGIYQYYRSDQEDMLKHHQEAFEKHEKIVRSHENNIMQMISGNKTQTNKRLHNLSKEIAGLKESLKFTQKDTEEKFNQIIEEISTMEMESVQFQERH